MSRAVGSVVTVREEAGELFSLGQEDFFRGLGDS